MEARQGAKDAQEHFLRHVERFVAVAQQVESQAENSSLVGSDQLGAGRIVTSDAAFDERRLSCVGVGPAYGAGVLHKCSGRGDRH